MKRLEVFCSISLLQRFLDKYYTIFESADDENMLELSLNWFNLLSKRSDLVLDISEGEAEELVKTNDSFLKFVKKTQRGSSHFIYDVNFDEELYLEERYSDFFLSIFLLDKSDEYCKMIEEKYGQIIFNNKRMFKYGHFIFNPTFYNVSKNKDKSNLKSWNDLRILSHPFNSMVITDNFLLKESDDVKFNLIPMLNALLPENIYGSTFHLSIFFYEEKGVAVDKRFELVNTLIDKKIGRDYKIELSLFSMTSKEYNHDRNIITNYLFLHSGYSFSYFKKDGTIKKDTTLFCLPLFTKKTEIIGYQINSAESKANSTYELAFKFLQRMIEISENHCKEKKVNCNNRLLEIKV